MVGGVGHGHPDLKHGHASAMGIHGHTVNLGPGGSSVVAATSRANSRRRPPGRCPASRRRHRSLQSSETTMAALLCLLVVVPVHQVRLFIGVVGRVVQEPVVVRRAHVLPAVAHHHASPCPVDRAVELARYLLQEGRVGFAGWIGLAPVFGPVLPDAIAGVVISHHSLRDLDTAQSERRGCDVHMTE